MKGSGKKGMKKSTKFFIAIGIVFVIVVMIEMTVSVFFARQFAAQHSGEQTSALHMH